MRFAVACVAFLLGCSASSHLYAETTDNRASEPRQPKPTINMERFGQHPADKAYGAFQRGLYLTAINLAKPLADEGNPSAQMLLAEIYARGLGVPRNEKEAVQWYIKAAEQGVPDAQFQYALMLIDGKHVKKDTEKAFSLLEKAAAQGNRLAQFNLAQIIIERDKSNASVKQALSWYRRAGEQNLPDAQYAMALALIRGSAGETPNKKEALHWLERAAQGGFDSAQLELGTWLVEGRAGEKNPELGFYWLRTAGLRGNVAAQIRVARLYRNGIGVEGNSIEAAAWYFLARRAGLSDPKLDVFLDGLTKEQQKLAIERANRLR